MKRVIFLNFVILLFATASASAVTLFVPDEHTVALWHLDGNGVDASGNGNHLAIKTDRVSFVPGKFSQAASMGDDPWSGGCFNSDGGALTAPGSGCTYPGSGDWTVEAWVKFPSNSAYYYAVSHYSKHWAGHDPYHLGINYGEAFFLLEDSSNNSINISSDVSAYVGQWIHLAGVYRYQQDTALYVNGVRVTYEDTTLVIENLPGYDVFVGGCYCGTSTGVIVDEVRLSNVARYGGAARILSPWQMRSDMTVGRHALSGAAVGGHIYSMGGCGTSCSPSDAHNTVERYNPTTDTWEKVAPMPTARHSLSCAVVDGYIYAIGGHVANSRSENQRYDPSTNTWQSMASKPTAVSGCGVAAFSGKIYAFGGNRYGSYQSVIEMYDPQTNTWQSVGNMPAAGNPWRAATLGDKIYVRQTAFTDTVWAYDPVAGTWDTSLPRLNIARSCSELVAVGDYLFAIGGGTAGGPLASVEWWTPGALNWTLDESLNIPRHQFGAAAIGNTIYAVGGYPPGNLASTESAVLVLEPTDPPVADAGDDVVVDANEVVILDGSASYDPDGQIIQYTWKRLPDEVVLYSGQDPNCQTLALGRAEEVIELSVMDNHFVTATDTVRIVSRATQDLEDRVVAMQSQIEELQRQIQELQAIVDKIVSWPPIRQRLEKDR
jgi:N-acetylneuraminic acid mutarotase